MLHDLLACPAILVAALHYCEVGSQQPIFQRDLSKRYFKGWDGLFTTSMLLWDVSHTGGKYQNHCMPPLYLVALVGRWDSWQNEMALPGRGAASRDAIYLRDIMQALIELSNSHDSKGAADCVWEYVSLWADVALTRVRLAATSWVKASPGLTLPYNYRSVTLAELYPRTRVYHSGGTRRLLD